VSIAQTQQPPPTPAEIEMEVRQNVLGQKLGDGTVADLALPEDFLRRVADRIVRSSYEERYRIVVEDAPPPPNTGGLGVPGPWIALFAATVALLAVAWASKARRKGTGAP
jgi:hypothetical protein